MCRGSVTKRREEGEEEEEEEEEEVKGKKKKKKKKEREKGKWRKKDVQEFYTRWASPFCGFPENSLIQITSNVKFYEG